MIHSVYDTASLEAYAVCLGGCRVLLASPRAAEARARDLLRERAARGLLVFERLQLRRQAERIERVRGRTRAAVATRCTRQPAPDPLPLDGLA